MIKRILPLILLPWIVWGQNPVDPGAPPVGESALLFDSTADRPAGPGLAEGNLVWTNVAAFLTWLGIEAGATADQSNAEIETAYNAQVAAASQVEAEAGTEVAIRRWSPLRIRQAINVLIGSTIQAHSAVLDATTAAFTTADETKLDGIETAATADQSDAEIETAYNAQVAAASQVEMEAGTETAIRRVSPLRVAEAIAAQVGGDFALHEADTSNPHSVTAQQAGAVPWHDAAVDPTANDDVTSFTEGTIWRNNQGTSSEADDTFFQLLDDTDTAAVWVQMVRLTAAGALNVASMDISGNLEAGTLTIGGVSALTESGTQTATNKTINGDNNTLSNLDLGLEVDWPDPANVTTATSPATGDWVLMHEVGLGLRKVLWENLPGSGGGDSIQIDSVAVVDPDFQSTGDIDFVNTSNVVTANINTAAVSAAELDEAGVEAGLEAVLDLPDLQGTLTVGKGGTGATTLTGVVKGNGTSAFTVAARSDINTVQATGNFSSPTVSNPYAPAATLMYGGCFFYGATGEIDLPAGAAGMNVIIYNTGAFTITIDPNASEAIVRDGTLQTGGVSFTLSSGAGNYVGLVWDGARWVTLGFKGVLSVGS